MKIKFGVSIGSKVSAELESKLAQHATHRVTYKYLMYDKRTHYMAVSFATYGDRGRFVDNHNVLVDMYEGDRLAGDRYFVPATIHTSG